MRLQYIPLICALPAALALSSCGVGGIRGLDLQPTPILSGGAGWAIVSESYIRLKVRPALDAVDVADLRDGSEVEILGREIGKDSAGAQALWYKIRVSDPGSAQLEGWVLGSELEIYESKLQADRALKAKSGK